MVYYILKYLVKYSVKLYFKDVIIFGLDKVPQEKPLVIASNHPSAFIEPALIGAFFPIEVYYMTRGDFFIKPVMWFFNGTNQIPIFRAKDGMKNLRRNNESFAKADKVLKGGGRVTIFPEASTMEVKRIRRLKNGASRLVANSSENNGKVPWIIAVITNYEDIHRWRSYVFISISDPYNPEELLRDDENHLAEITTITSEMMKGEAIHIEDYKDDSWVNALIQVVTEEWRSGMIQAEEEALFRKLQEVARISEAEEKEKIKLRPVAEEIISINDKTSTFLGSAIEKLSIVDYLKLIFMTGVSLPAILFLLIPIIPATIVRRKKGISREFRVPIFVGIILAFSTIMGVLLLTLLILNPANWILWAYILILPISFYCFRKWGDILQKVSNTYKFKKLTVEERKRYKELRKEILNYFSL